MATRLPDTVGHERLRRYCTQVIGGLEARTELVPEAAPWHAMRERVVRERAEREAADDAVTVAGARVRVADVDWDTALGDVSGVAFLAAGKKADADPYAPLFGRITASRARSLGRIKAVEVGARVVRDGRRLDVPELAEPLDGLDRATTTLKAGSDAYDAADDALFAPRLAKRRCVRDVNDLIAVTEARILTAFPGRSDLVSAILLPWFERKRSGPNPANNDDEEDDGTTDDDTVLLD